MSNRIMMPVYDCQKMPDKVRQAFYELTESAGNDCYVSHFIGDALEEEKNDPGSHDKKVIEQYKVLEEWLIANGATIGEHVLINHWW